MIHINTKFIESISYVLSQVGKIILAVVSFALIILSVSASGETLNAGGVDEKLGQKAWLDASFFDEKGEKADLRQLTDKPVIISLVYFSCQSRCPLLLGNLAGTLGKTDINPEEYRIITVSFDPRDTPALSAEKKRNYLKAIGRPFPGSSWKFLTGDQKNITDFTRSVGFSFNEEKAGFSHPRALIFLAPGGRISRYLYGMSFSPFDISMALKEASGKGLLSKDSLSLFCFSYNPGENRYVFNFGRSFTLAVFFLLVSASSLIFAARRKERENR